MPLNVPSAVGRRLLGVCVSASLLLSGCSDGKSPVLAALSDQAGAVFHQCVPLGWVVVPVARTYYPGSDFSVYQEGVIAQPYWLGRMSRRAMATRDGREVLAMLDRLSRAGLVARDSSRGAATTFWVTRAGAPFVDSADSYADNREAYPYLCFSKIVPTTIVQQKALPDEPATAHSPERERFSVTFDWTASAPAAWANDPYIRSHSVILAPTTSPAVATLVKIGDEWVLQKLDDSNLNDPVAVNPAVWKRSGLAALHRHLDRR
jgi:hypothetical protein